MLNNLLFNDITHRHVDTSPSTNSELLSAIQNGKLDADACHLLTATLQTAGRGQHGRTWQSPKGNVYLSLYHPIKVPVSGLLSLIVGYYLTQTPIIMRLNEYRHTLNLPLVGVKWANDIGFYDTQDINVNDSSATNFNKLAGVFNKLAGILIEPVLAAQRLQGVVIGVGLNITTTPQLTQSLQEGLPYRAISIADLTNSQDLTAKQPLFQNTNNKIPCEDKYTPPLNDIYQQITQSLCDAMSCFTSIQENKFTSVTNSRANSSHTDNNKCLDDFIKAYTGVDVLANKQVRVTCEYPNPSVTAGIAVGLDQHGCLLVQQANLEIAHIFTGKVALIDA